MPAPDVSTLARKFKLDVNISSSWTQVKGVAEFKAPLTPSLEDDSVYDDEGWGSQTKTALAWTIETKVIRRKSAPGDVYDPGQEALRAASELFGADGQVYVRWYDRDGGVEAYEGYAEVTWTPDGGPNTALETVVVTLTGRGARTVIANPA